MSNVDADSLYQLLPAVYRLRDPDQGYPLRALIQILASQAEIVEGDIKRLYKNAFIEACEEWVVPYLGDLLGVRGLLPPERAGWSQRALVANTLNYRQRKGTLPLLEQLAWDVPNWPAKAVELYTRVGVTQYLDHLRPGVSTTANLHTLSDKSLVGSAFDPLTYTPDVRLMSGTRQPPQNEPERPVPPSGRRLVGVSQVRPNLPNIGLYIWRLKPYRIEKATAFSYKDGHRFSFSPLGNDMPLYNCPASRQAFDTVAKEFELPVALRNQALSDELAARLESPATGFFTPQHAFEIFTPQHGFEIFTDSGSQPVDFGQVIVVDLANWSDPSFISQLTQQYSPKFGLAVDAEKGRIFSFQSAAKVSVSYSYAFSDDIGGGPYNRQTQSPSKVVDSTDENGLINTLNSWTGQPVIQIERNITRLTPAINLNGSALVIQAANLSRPTILGDIAITGGGPTAELTLSGFLITGQIKLLDEIRKLTIVDCTLVPGDPALPITPSIVATNPGGSLQVTIQRSIVGPISLPSTIGGLVVSDSIIDAPSPPAENGLSAARRPSSLYAGVIVRPLLAGKRPPAISGPATTSDQSYGLGPSTQLERVTVFGSVSVAAMPTAQDVLFTDTVTVDKARVGQMRNCYVPTGASMPTISIQDCIQGSPTLLPAFVAQRYGQPGYAQLSLACPTEIRSGGTDGAEIGVFQSLHQPQREGALLAQLQEYLRFGLEAGLIYVS